jgi:hypothetical protein
MAVTKIFSMSTYLVVAWYGMVWYGMVGLPPPDKAETVAMIVR